MKSLLLPFLALTAAQAAETPWRPVPAAGPPESRRVLIVKQGMEHNRTYDGHVHGINSHHRYRIDRLPDSGRWKIRAAQDDVQRFRDLDVDGDGRTENDAVAAHAWDLSLANPISMVAPWYDTTVGTQRFTGGIAVYQANVATTGLTEDGMNDAEEGPANQPRRNWTLFREIVDVLSPFRLCAALVWQKPDFLNGGATGRVSFDDTCTLRLWPGRYFMGIDAMRLLVRNGDQFYLSEHSCQGIGLHIVHPTRTRWTRYDPQAPHAIWLDPAKMKFETVKFDDVTALGWYVAKDRLVSGYFGCKWEAFDADAIVTAPAAPSSLIRMAPLQGPGVPPLFMATCEVPYELWRQIHRVVRAPAHAGFPGFNFDDQGDMGSMDYTVYADPNHAWTDSQNQPVTDLHLYDLLAWCNALSAYESRTPCYYEDPDFKTLFREVLPSPAVGAPRPRPTIYVKWDADGFRLPTPAEWSLGGGGPRAEPAKATHAVGQGPANAQGIYDLAGNVWEPLWTFGDKLAPADFTTWTVAGGSFLPPAEPHSISASPYGDDAFHGRFDIGLRLVRRQAGLPPPPIGRVAGAPTWTIRKGEKTAAVPARQPRAAASPPLVPTVAIPGRPYALGTHEVPFAQYRTVHDWAVAHGYEFDYGGEMGSMAYWGFGDTWQPGTRTADEPVTGVSHSDVLIWLNALSELEGRRPVYYADEARTQPLRRMVHYRPDMAPPPPPVRDRDHPTTEISRATGLERLMTPFFIRADADGYRLPTYEEFRHAAFAGRTGRFPWGDDPAGGADHAWMADWSGFQTHPVGRRQPNPFGLFDLIGNVSELAQDATGPGEGMSAGYSFRLGGSYQDVVDRFDTILRLPRLVAKTAPSQSRGLVYPDVGFRLLLQTGTAPAAAAPERRDANAPARRRATAASAPAPFDALTGQVHRANLQRTGDHYARGVPQLTGVKWSTPTGGPVRSSPVVTGGVLYVGSYDHRVYAIDAKTGAERWHHDAGGPVSGSAAVVGGVVFIASEAGRLFALDARDGRPRWQAETGGRTAGAPAVVAGRVFIGGGGPRAGGTALSMSARPLLAFDAATGAPVWIGDSGPQGPAAIAADGQRLYAGVGGSNFGAFGLADGQLAWTYRSGHQRRQFASLTVVGDAVFVPVAIGGFVARLDAATGREQWINAAHEPNLRRSMNQGGEFGHETLTDVAVADGLVFAAFNDGQVIAFNAATGAKVWTVRCGSSVQSSPSVAAGIMYVGSWDGQLYALDAKTGAVRWRQRLGGKVNSSPWPADGVVYVGCDDGRIYAVH